MIFHSTKCGRLTIFSATVNCSNRVNHNIQCNEQYILSRRISQEEHPLGRMSHIQLKQTSMFRIEQVRLLEDCIFFLMGLVIPRLQIDKICMSSSEWLVSSTVCSSSEYILQVFLRQLHTFIFVQYVVRRNLVLYSNPKTAGAKIHKHEQLPIMHIPSQIRSRWSWERTNTLDGAGGVGGRRPGW